MPAGRSEEGAAMIFVALSLGVIIGIVVLVVDAGSLWAGRRVLVAGTSAAAISAATAYALGTDGCADARTASALDANSPGAVLDCERGTGDWVSVRSASAPVPTAFGAALGHAPTVVRASASAAWRPVRTVDGLRPLGVCISDPNVAGWIGAGPAAEPGPHTFAFENGPGSCGWTTLVPDPDTDLESALVGGVHVEVGIDDCNADATLGDACAADDNPSRRAFEVGLGVLRDASQPVVIALVDDRTDTAGGPNYRIAGFLGAIVRGFDVSGPRDAWTIDLEQAPVVARGSRAESAVVEGGVRSIGVCGIDTVPGGDDARCGTG